ncbi:serine/threonine-protein kinase [Mucilaginibacter frigoritolerans]|uniref:Serine/threonine-protein kinase n=1 Tax=Mucilaginibacter frigoritolerans TaxID=652788 RepID=A0A562TN81_9SPHI|nr:serine/threonine-protein kinase [Mucilaginibacter frigoritolerans]TWI95029.1 serine/threonine-protein kinase [Mucilaginibacter frigoritolerans]
MSKVFTIAKGLENMGALRTGGQGSVYKGRRMGPIISAVKLLPTPIHTEDDDDKNFRNFQNEVNKLKKVNERPNPNVVKILASGLTESGSFPYIEMEFIEGPDLEELLKPPHDPVFTIKEVLKLADHLANALSHCHMVGVKHGDIKSNNIKYNIHSGNYVLLDFGLAIMSDEQRRTSIRHAGAIEFMAPEQNTGAMYMATDIYSYGIILYELLAGQVPFPLHDSGETARNAVMIAHMESPVPDVLALRKKNLPAGWTEQKRDIEMRVPKWLLTLISTCLEKDPEKRYLSGMSLQEALFDGSLSTGQPAVSLDQLPDKAAFRNTKPALGATGVTYHQGDKMHISKPLFFALMGMFAISLITCGYLLINQNLPPVPIKTTAADTTKKDTDTPKQATVHDYHSKERANDSAAQQAIKDVIDGERQKAESQKKADSTGTPQDTSTVKQPDNNP